MSEQMIKLTYVSNVIYSKFETLLHILSFKTYITFPVTYSLAIEEKKSSSIFKGTNIKNPKKPIVILFLFEVSTPEYHKNPNSK